MSRDRLKDEKPHEGDEGMPPILEMVGVKRTMCPVAPVALPAGRDEERRKEAEAWREKIERSAPRRLDGQIDEEGAKDRAQDRAIGGPAEGRRGPEQEGAGCLASRAEQILHGNSRSRKRSRGWVNAGEIES